VSDTLDPQMQAMLTDDADLRLICPECHGGLSLVEDQGGGLECEGCGRVYPVRDGVPVMLSAEASPPTQEKTGC